MAPHSYQSGKETSSDSGISNPSDSLSESLKERSRSSNPSFKLIEELGSGGAGTVYRAGTSRPALYNGNSQVAIKAVRRTGITKRELLYLQREIAIHRYVSSHPRICSFYHHYSDRNYIYIIMEILNGGDMLTFLKKAEIGCPESMSLRIISQVLDALAHMHKNGIAHRDIKPENIIFEEKVDLRNPQDVQVKLIDFGLASFRKDSSTPKERMSAEKVGTIRYVAPEVMRGEAYTPEEVDMWSVGITLYTLLACRNPYVGLSESEVLKNVETKKLNLFEGSEWKEVSPETIQLIKKLLSVNSQERPTASESLETIEGILKQLKSPKDSFDEESDRNSHQYDGVDLLSPRARSSRTRISQDHLRDPLEEPKEGEKEEDKDSIIAKIYELFSRLTDSPSNESDNEVQDANNSQEEK